MERESAPRPATSTETIRRGFVWASVLIGAAIVLKDVVEATDFTYLMLVIFTAWIVDQTPPSSRLAASRWAGPVSAGIVVAVAIAIKVVMEW